MNSHPLKPIGQADGMSKLIVAPALGFVGVRRGLSYPQFQAVCRILVTRKGRGALAGVAVARYANDGWAASDFTRIARWMPQPPRLAMQEAGGTAELAPLSVESLASWAEFSVESDTVPAWNREIVDNSDLLLACPPVPVEEPRSRTWAAVRYARKCGKPVLVVYPNGEIIAGGREYFLVNDTTPRTPVAVFLCRDPKLDGYTSMPVRPAVLETMTIHDRVGAARPVLGRSRQDSHRYREFPDEKSLRRSGFQLVGSYRVCDTWDDYHFPWVSAPEEDLSPLSELETGADHHAPKTDAEMPNPLRTVGVK